MMAGLKSNILEGRSGSYYIPAVPLWIAIIRIFQATIAVTMFILITFSQTVLRSDFSGYSLADFTVVYTLQVLTYLFCTNVFCPRRYHISTHLCMETLVVIFWLATWITLCTKAISFNDAETQIYTIGDNNYTFGTLPSKAKTAIDCTKASVGLGSLEWVLFIITFAFHGVSFYRPRNANSVIAAPAATSEVHDINSMAGDQPVVQHFC